MTQKEGERKDTHERYATVGTGGEPFEELQSQISYREVEEALKRMKRGKGVMGDKISMEMIQGEGRSYGTTFTHCYNAAGRKSIFRKIEWKESSCHDDEFEFEFYWSMLLKQLDQKEIRQNSQNRKAKMAHQHYLNDNLNNKKLHNIEEVETDRQTEKKVDRPDKDRDR